MCRFMRQLLGKGRREALADEELRRHREEFARGIRPIRANVAAVEQLMRHLERDTTSWH